MTNLSENTETLEKVFKEADAKLPSVDPSPFSSEAFLELKGKISEYITLLVSESLNVSKRHQADVVSATHVEIASSYLVTRSRKRIFGHIGMVGGILLGAAISNVLAMVTVQQYTVDGILVTVSLTAIGTFMVAIHIAKE